MSNQISNNGGAHGDGAVRSMKCSAFEVRVMAMMSADDYTTSRRLAEKAWEKKGGGVGRRNAQWQRMGACLWRMKERGLVTYRTTDHGQNEWRLRVQTPNNGLCDSAAKTDSPTL